MILRFDFDPCSTAWDVSFTFTELFCARRWQQYFTQHFNTSDANCIELTSTKKTLNILAKRGRVSCQSVVPWSRIQSHKSLWFGIKTLVSWKVWLFQLAWELDFDISSDQLWPLPFLAWELVSYEVKDLVLFILCEKLVQCSQNCETMRIMSCHSKEYLTLGTNEENAISQDCVLCQSFLIFYMYISAWYLYSVYCGPIFMNKDAYLVFGPCMASCCNVSHVFLCCPAVTQSCPCTERY